MSTGVALLLIFVVLPFVVAPIIVSLVARRSPSMPAEYRTSELLAHGEIHRAEVLEWVNRGQFLDPRPMVSVRLQVDAADPFELVVTQSVPRRLLGKLRAGEQLEVRLSADHRAGAVVLPEDDESDDERA